MLIRLHLFVTVRRPPSSTPAVSSAASNVYKSQAAASPGDRALLGQAGRSQAEPGSGSGRLPASRSIWQASEKQLIRLHETHTFELDLQNRSFRLREMTTFRTPKPIDSQSALDDPRPDDPKAPHIFPSGQKHHTSAAKCVVFPAWQNETNQIPLLNVTLSNARLFI